MAAVAGATVVDTTTAEGREAMQKKKEKEEKVDWKAISALVRRVATRILAEVERRLTMQNKAADRRRLMELKGELETLLGID